MEELINELAKVKANLTLLIADIEITREACDKEFISCAGLDIVIGGETFIRAKELISKS